MSAAKFYTYGQAVGKRSCVWLGKSFLAAPREHFPDTVRPLFPVAALAERTVCWVLLLIAVAALAGRPKLASTSIAGALSSHSAPLGKRLFDHILHVFAARRRSRKPDPFHGGGEARKKKGAW